MEEIKNKLWAKYELYEYAHTVKRLTTNTRGNVQIPLAERKRYYKNLRDKNGDRVVIID